MNVFIINGGQTFAHSGGMFNNTLTGWTVEVIRERLCLPGDQHQRRIRPDGGSGELQMGGHHYLPHTDLVVPAS